ncbi:MAG: hypothetical protein NPINA01_12730 [Nitrospinaceae bacterium]|nr:MAG: hypothetical protein NPINA01_12730 [Nitrospinaceae bacterium]
MKIRFFKNTRNFHKWIGLVCAVFFIILSLSGFILMHYEGLGLNEVEVSGKFLPDKYFQIESSKRSIQTIAATPEDFIYVGTDHGLYRSQDGGNTWTELKEGLFHQNIKILTVDPIESGVIYAGTPGGIFKTENGGDHWTDWIDAASGLSNADVNDIAIHPKDSEKLYAATEGGLFFSEDAGGSWEILFGGNDAEKGIAVTLVRLSSVNSEAVYIGTQSGMYRSVDAGKNWEPVWKDQISDALTMVSLKTEPEFFYIGTRDGLFKSFNQGRNWEKDKHKEIDEVSSLLVNPEDIANLTVSTGERILVSPDGGDSWEQIEFDPDRQSTGASSFPRLTGIYQIGPPSPVFIAGTTSGLFLSTDGGKNWQEQELSNSGKQPQERKMDLVKLFTEIHTGRFFGSYFVLLVDLATLGLILLVISGIWVGIARKKMRKGKKGQPAGELETELLINVQETADDLSVETHEIHDMIEHISNHLEKCKSVYMSKEKKEIEEIDRHITTLDKKMHHLMERIGEFEKYSQN